MVGVPLARVRLAVLLACAAVVACGEAAPPPPSEPAGDGSDSSASGAEIPVYEQSFVFASAGEESLFVVPWLLRTTSVPGTDKHEARGWLGRDGTWDAFYSEEWETPPIRMPGRILPHGDLHLLVQDGDVVDGIIFDDGTRKLELALGEARATWRSPRGEVVELVDGAAYLSEERVDGLILHMARASTGTQPPGGDWAFLVSGDSVSLVLAADAEHGGEVEPLYRAWGLVGANEVQWPEVRVDWTSTQAFPPARRDVPVAWRVWSPDATIEGELEAVSSEIRAGSGPGPLLPVLALFDVQGQIFTSDGDFPVRGLLVHERR